MLKRLLASIAITSLLLLLVMLVYWWRGLHGHVDTFTLGKGTNTESVFTSSRNVFSGQGQVLLEVTDRQSATVVTTIRPYFYRKIIGYFLIVPGFWAAIKVRSLLPRPPGRLEGRRWNTEDRG